PVAMLAAVARVCAAHAAPLWVCLEAYMGCGMGVCMGCVVPTVRGMERVCHEGPVFAGTDVLWEQVAM
ncbi:MAG: dihydroorotate dehydrogenase, partial [bacterium]|nr:dihydroorotate dehydrogenase [bacterium]